MIHRDIVEGDDRDGWFNSQQRGTDGEKEIKISGNKRTWGRSGRKVSKEREKKEVEAETEKRVND